MLNNIFTKEKIKSTLFTIVGLILVVIITIWFSSNRVSADVWPIYVIVSHIDFGTVFPGETLQENFEIIYLDEIPLNYRIVQKIKPLPDVLPPLESGYELISNYCQDNPDDLTRCYCNLCPFLEKVSVEAEGDTEDAASMDVNDNSDIWTIYFQVPAIFGNVSQDHIGGVITEGGEYGCDVSIEIIEE